MRARGPILTRLLSAVLLAVLTVTAQDYQIRTRVDLVVVPVTVKASGDRLISGLGLKDFLVFENGVQQTISTFSIDPVPLSAVVLVDTGLTGATFEKIKKTIPALTGAFSAFDEVAAYRFDTFVLKLVDF